MNNMETFWANSHAAGAQSSYLESLYESYIENPTSVPDDWKIYFDSLPVVNGGHQEVSHKEIIERLKENEVNPSIQSLPNNIRDSSVSGSTDDDLELDSSKKNTGFNFTWKNN